MIVGTTNFLAVAISALIPMVIGFLWYSKILFGNRWMGYEGITPEEDAKMEREPMLKKLVIAYITYFLIAYTLATLINYLVVASIIPAMALGALVWLGFVVPSAISDYLWSPKAKPWGLYYLHVSYFLVSIILVSIVLALWI